MENLLEKIGTISQEAASALRSAGFTSDSDIRSLNRQDLQELLPGKDKLRVRKEVHEFICEVQQQSYQGRIESVLKNFIDSFPSESLKDANISSNGPLLEYLHIWKNITEELIGLLERNKDNRPNRVNSVRYDAAPEASAAVTEKTKSGFSLPWPRLFWSSQEKQVAPSSKITSNRPPAVHRTQSLQTPINVVTVMCRTVVSGKTLGKHMDVMDKLNAPLPGDSECLQLKESQQDEDSQVTIVFCPIVSRAGTDLAIALQDISGDKPVILVAMYHLHSPKGLPPPRETSPVELGVNIFFHETVGLLECPQNNEAINKMKTWLLEISTKKRRSNPQ